MRVRIVPSLCAVMLAATSLWARQTVPAAAPVPDAPDVQAPSQPDDPAYTLHAITREVSLDVVVVDAKGKPVHGLTREDFKVLDEGSPEKLRGFTEHDESEAANAPDFKLPPNTFTNYVPVSSSSALFVILFDSLDSPVDVQQRAFVAATDFLKKMAPGTSVAIFDLHDRMNLVQGFTTDRTLLLNALKDQRTQPRSSPLLGTGNDVLRRRILDEGMLTLGRYLSGFPERKNLIWFLVNMPGSFNSRTATLQAGGPPGSLNGAGVGTDILQNAASAQLSASISPEQARQQQQLGNGGPPVGVQNGSSPPFGAQPVAPQQQTGAVQLVDKNALNPFESLTNLIDDSKSTSDLLTLSRVVVYIVDPRQLMSPFELAQNPGYLFEQGAMQDIAEATGGEAFVNRNGITSIMQEIVSKGSDFYTLTYSPQDIKWDGSFRKLKVETAGKASQMSGLHLEYRPGYHTADRIVSRRSLAAGFAGGGGNDRFLLASETRPGAGPINSPDALPRESLQASMTVGQIPPTELILTASVKPSAGEPKLVNDAPLPEGNYIRDKFKRQPYRTYSVLFATDAHALQLPRSPDGLHHGGVEFVAAVYTDQGDVVNSLKVNISLNLKDETYRALLRNGIGTKRSLVIPAKGKYIVRLGVHDLNSDRVGALEFPMTDVAAGVAGVGQQEPEPQEPQKQETQQQKP